MFQPFKLFLFLLIITSIGNSQAPYLVKNIHTSFNTPSYPNHLTKVNNTLFFSADNGTVGEELWKSDGTTSGTVLVKDIIPGGTGSNSLRGFTEVNGSLFFSAKNGQELWKSNGTSANTILLKNTSTIGSILDKSFISFNNALLFVIADPTTGDYQLWKSNGTSSTTTLIKSFAYGGNSIDVSTLKIFGNELFFTANDGISGREIWKTDGTVGGTVMVKDIQSGTSDGIPWPNPPFFSEVNGNLFFIGNDGVNGEELWKTDGTNAGTVMIKDIRPGAGSSGIGLQTSTGSKLFFSTFMGGSNALWVSDGTNSGTIKVTDVSYIEEIMTLDSNTLLFVQKTTSPVNYGRELWKTDGTVSGTSILKDINPGSGDGLLTNYRLFQQVDSVIFFKADDGVHGEELWKTDGTDSGTVMVKDMKPGSGRGFLNTSEIFYEANGLLFFDGIPLSGGLPGTVELWRSDGTDTGTYRYDIDTNGNGSRPRQLTLIDTTLFFSATDGFTGVELYALHVDTIAKVVVPSTSAIHEKESNNWINVYPNPTSDYLTLEMDNSENSSPALVKIITLQGKVVYSKPSVSNRVTFDLTSYPKGIYIVEIRTNNKQVARKIIKY